MKRLSEIGGKRLPFLRWSVIRMALGLRQLTRDWQVGDGREEALAAYVAAHARRNDLDDVIRTIDTFCYEQSMESEHGFAPGSVDFVFVDHDKAAYLPDLERILDRGWLHAGSGVVADNVKIPGAPAYRAYMTAQQGRTWRTTEHETHLEYQSLLKDLVLESEYLGGHG